MQNASPPGRRKSALARAVALEQDRLKWNRIALPFQTSILLYLP